MSLLSVLLSVCFLLLSICGMENRLNRLHSVSYLHLALDDAAELAEELGVGSKWDLASDCAAKMLPGVFRPDTLSFKVKFAPDKVQGLEELLEGLAPETFGACAPARSWSVPKEPPSCFFTLPFSP